MEGIGIAHLLPVAPIGPSDWLKTPLVGAGHMSFDIRTLGELSLCRFATEHKRESFKNHSDLRTKLYMHREASPWWDWPCAVCQHVFNRLSLNICYLHGDSIHEAIDVAAKNHVSLQISRLSSQQTWWALLKTFIKIIELFFHDYELCNLEWRSKLLS